MSRLSLELIPSKPLLLSDQALKTLSKTFKKQGATILEKSSDKTLRLNINFLGRKNLLRHEIDEAKQRIEKLRESSEPVNESIIRTLKTLLKALRAEANALSSNFFLGIAENQVTIEANIRRLSELSFFYFQIQLRTIIAYISEAYAEMGCIITFTEKHGGLLEKLSNLKNENKYY